MKINQQQFEVLCGKLDNLRGQNTAMVTVMESQSKIYAALETITASLITEQGIPRHQWIHKQLTENGAHLQKTNERIDNMTSGLATQQDALKTQLQGATDGLASELGEQRKLVEGLTAQLQRTYIALVTRAMLKTGIKKRRKHDTHKRKHRSK